MAKKDKFKLEKGVADHNYNLAKGGKRKFDLRKDEDDTVAAPVIDTTNVLPDVVEPMVDNQTPQPVNGGDAPKGKSGKWIWILVIAALIAVLFVWLITSRDKKAEGPEATEQVTNLPETAPNEENGMTAEEATATDAEAPEAATSAESPEIAETPETPAPEAAAPQAAPAAPAQKEEPAAKPAERPKAAAPEKASPADVSDDVDAEALNVISGKYGNNPLRKKALGKKYRKIQKRVNQMKRQGKF